MAIVFGTLFLHVQYSACLVHASLTSHSQVNQMQMECLYHWVVTPLPHPPPHPQVCSQFNAMHVWNQVSIGFWNQVSDSAVKRYIYRPTSSQNIWGKIPKWHFVLEIFHELSTSFKHNIIESSKYSLALLHEVRYTVWYTACIAGKL